MLTQTKRFNLVVLESGELSMDKVKEGFSTLLLVIVVGGVSVVGWEIVKGMRTGGQAGYEQLVPIDQSLKLPENVKTTIGKPIQILADTRGKEVMWLSLDKEVNILPLDSKSIWAWSNRIGIFRVIAWTSLNDKPSPPVFCSLVVEEESKEEPKKEASVTK